MFRLILLGKYIRQAPVSFSLECEIHTWINKLIRQTHFYETELQLRSIKAQLKLFNRV